VWLFSDSICFKEVLISTPPGGGLNSPDEGDVCFPPNVHTTFHSFHQPWEVEGSQQMSSYSHHHQHLLHHHHAFSTTTSTIAPSPFSFQPMYCPDIVPIKVVTQSLSLSLSLAFCLFSSPSVICCNFNRSRQVTVQ
jgi:hypothetical protein